MDKSSVLEIVNQIYQAVFDRDNFDDLGMLYKKYAKNIRLPHLVKDSISGDETWTTASHGNNFITNQNVSEIDNDSGWMKPNQRINEMVDLLDLWREINCITTERVYDSINVSRSDTIYACENVYQSTDCRGCNNIIYTSSCGDCEYLLGCERSGNCNFCINVSDSGNCSNSYRVVCSNKILNSMFIQDCFDLYECMFCAHITSRRYCIANMELEQADYYRVKELVLNWIFTGSFEGLLGDYS